MDVLPPDPAGIRRALDVLRGGGIVAHATETCYGLACDLTNAEAVTMLFERKRRPAHQPVSALFAAIEATESWVLWNPKARALGEHELPGPLTIILPIMLDRVGTIFPTPAGGTTLGIRISPHPVAVALARGFGKPLSTTSANVHGQPNPYSLEDIQNQYGDTPGPDLLLDSGLLEHRPPSTIVDFATSDGAVLR